MGGFRETILRAGVICDGPVFVSFRARRSINFSSFHGTRMINHMKGVHYLLFFFFFQDSQVGNMSSKKSSRSSHLKIPSSSVESLKKSLLNTKGSHLHLS